MTNFSFRKRKFLLWDAHDELSTYDLDVERMMAVSIRASSYTMMHVDEYKPSRGDIVDQRFYSYDGRPFSGHGLVVDNNTPIRRMLRGVRRDWEACDADPTLIFAKMLRRVGLTQTELFEYSDSSKLMTLSKVLRRGTANALAQSVLLARLFSAANESEGLSAAYNGSTVNAVDAHVIAGNFSIHSNAKVDAGTYPTETAIQQLGMEFLAQEKDSRSEVERALKEQIIMNILRRIGVPANFFEIGKDPWLQRHVGELAWGVNHAWVRLKYMGRSIILDPGFGLRFEVTKGDWMPLSYTPLEKQITVLTPIQE